MLLYKISDNEYQYQYDGRALFKDIVEWCKHNLDSYSHSMETIYIYSDEAATMFLLRWS